MVTSDNKVATVAGSPTRVHDVGSATEGAGTTLTPGLLWTMTIASGLVIANVYYNQPLLADMARSFHVSAGQIGWVAMLTQAGFSSGMLFLAPLGDATDRRRMVAIMCLAASLALAGVAVAPTFAILGLASYVVGLGSIVPQLLVPFAAYLARPQEQGRAVGTVLTGLLIGILLARTFSGYIGQQLGWRAMFGIASALMLVLAVVLHAWLPRTQPRAPLSYGRLLWSLGTLLAEQPVLREGALTGAVMFAAFSAFWATLAFRLEAPPYHYGSQVAGLFGLVGVVGALGASVAGRWTDRRDARQLLRISVVLELAALIAFWMFGRHLWGLIAGVILLDAGTQGGSACNQARNYRVLPEAHNRVASIYLTAFFIGGSVGTALGTHAWQHFGYAGVCATGIVLTAIAGIKVLLPLAKPAR